jgi:hypothetical protein
MPGPLAGVTGALGQGQDSGGWVQCCPRHVGNTRCAPPFPGNSHLLPFCSAALERSIASRTLRVCRRRPVHPAAASQPGAGIQRRHDRAGGARGHAGAACRHGGRPLPPRVLRPDRQPRARGGHARRRHHPHCQRPPCCRHRAQVRSSKPGSSPGRGAGSMFTFFPKLGKPASSVQRDDLDHIPQLLLRMCVPIHLHGCNGVLLHACRDLTAMLHQGVHLQVAQSRPQTPTNTRTIYLPARPVEVYPVIHNALRRCACTLSPPILSVHGSGMTCLCTYDGFTLLNPVSCSTLPRARAQSHAHAVCQRSAAACS